MRRSFLTVLTALFLVVSAPAQAASFTTFGSPCNGSAINITGVPKLGGSFTVNRVLFPGFCTRKFCQCNCCDCNDCSGSVLFLGLVKVSAPLPGTNCPLLLLPLEPVFPSASGTITIQVPNLPNLNGVKFYMQRIDVRLKEVQGSQCATTYRPLSFAGTSEGVEGTIGT